MLLSNGYFDYNEQSFLSGEIILAKYAYMTWRAALTVQITRKRSLVEPCQTKPAAKGWHRESSFFFYNRDNIKSSSPFGTFDVTLVYSHYHLTLPTLYLMTPIEGQCNMNHLLHNVPTSKFIVCWESLVESLPHFAQWLTWMTRNGSKIMLKHHSIHKLSCFFFF